MSFFGLLLIIFLIFIFQPVFRGLAAAWRFRKQMRSAYRQASSNSYGSRASSRPGGWSAPAPHRSKIITREMGEYVAFEDIAVAATSTSADGTKTSSTIEEQQIIDAEWEEIR